MPPQYVEHCGTHCLCCCFPLKTFMLDLSWVLLTRLHLEPALNSMPPYLHGPLSIETQRLTNRTSSKLAPGFCNVWITMNYIPVSIWKYVLSESSTLQKKSSTETVPALKLYQHFRLQYQNIDTVCAVMCKAEYISSIILLGSISDLFTTTPIMHLHGVQRLATCWPWIVTTLREAQWHYYFSVTSDVTMWPNWSVNIA